MFTYPRMTIEDDGYHPEGERISSVEAPGVGKGPPACKCLHMKYGNQHCQCHAAQDVHRQTLQDLWPSWDPDENGMPNEHKYYQVRKQPAKAESEENTREMQNYYDAYRQRQISKQQRDRGVDEAEFSDSGASQDEEEEDADSDESDEAIILKVRHKETDQPSYVYVRQYKELSEDLERAALDQRQGKGDSNTFGPNGNTSMIMQVKSEDKVEPAYLFMRYTRRRSLDDWYEKPKGAKKPDKTGAAPKPKSPAKSRVSSRTKSSVPPETQSRTSSGTQSRGPSGAQSRGPSGAQSRATSGAQSRGPSGAQSRGPSGAQSRTPSGAQSSAQSGAQSRGPSDIRSPNDSRVASRERIPPEQAASDKPKTFGSVVWDADDENTFKMADRTQEKQNTPDPGREYQGIYVNPKANSKVEFSVQATPHKIDGTRTTQTFK